MQDINPKVIQLITSILEDKNFTIKEYQGHHIDFSKGNKDFKIILHLEQGGYEVHDDFPELEFLIKPGLYCRVLEGNMPHGQFIFKELPDENDVNSGWHKFKDLLDDLAK